MDLMGLLPLEADSDMVEKITPDMIHNCQVPEEDDEIELYIPGSGFFVQIHRWITRQRVVSPTNYDAQNNLKSSTAIKNEIFRHLHEYPYMIHPFSNFRSYWCTSMAALTYLTLMLVPFYQTFYYHDRILLLPHMLFIDFILLLDTFLNFFVGHFDERTKTIYLDRSIVFWRYLQNYFLCDLISGFPIELFDLMINDNLTWYSAAVNMTKILRVRNLIKYITGIRKAWRWSYQKMQILKLLIAINTSIHWGTCIVYLVPLMVTEPFPVSVDEKKEFKQEITDWVRGRTWIKHDSFTKRKTVFKKYILCQNRAMISIINAFHYLDVSSIEDMIVNFLLTLVGKVRYIFLLAGFYQVIMTFHSADQDRLRVLQQLREYMRYRELPISTQKRLTTYTNYWYKKNFHRDKQILSQLSTPLREALIFHNYLNLLQTVDFFKYLPREALVRLINYIKSEIYLLNDTIVKAGSAGHALFFIGSGTVAVYTGLGKEVCHLEDGAYFGEIALVMENEQRIASVVAIETCEILVVPREAFQSVIGPYPNLLNRLQKVALERLEKTLFLDEIYKLEDPRPRYINISNIRGKKRLG